MKLEKVDLEITSSCNLKCIHCFANANFKKQEMKLVDFKNLADDLSENGVKYISISGGEPLLHKDFWKMADYASEKGLFVSILTNATLLKNSGIKKIKKIKNLNHIQISIDGATAETHDGIRGVKGSFKKATSAIDLLIKEKIPVTVRTIIMEPNVKEIAKIAGFCSSKNTECVISLINPVGRANSTIYPTIKDYSNSVTQLFDTEETSVTNQLNPCGNACGVGFNMIAVLPNGDIAPCMPMRNFVLGNVKTDDIFDVFKNHPVMKKIRLATPGKIKECKRCPAVKRCAGGCKQRVFAMHNRFDAPDDVQCVIFKKNHRPKLENPGNFPLK